jgi:DNA mismatch repair protein MutS
MQARHTPRGAELVGGSDPLSSDHQFRPRQNVGTLERRPAGGAIVSADASASAAPAGRAEREVATIAFRSILFPPGAVGRQQETADQPEFFRDLNLDQVVAAITAGKDDYDLPPLFYSPIRDLLTIDYRQAVMRDLEQDEILRMVRGFAEGMRSTRKHLSLSAKLHYAHQKKLWFLDAVATYCIAVAALAHEFHAANLQSPGLAAFRRYLIDYTNSEGFEALVAETCKIKADLSTVKYSTLIKSDKITVEKYEDTSDYSAVVERTFDRFQQAAVKS